MTLEEVFGYAIDYEARHQTVRLFFRQFSRFQQPSYRDSEEKIPSPEGRSTPNGLKSTKPAQDPDERLRDFDSPAFANNFDQQQQHTLNVKFNPYQNLPMYHRVDYRYEWRLHCTRQIDPETSTKTKERRVSVETLRQREKSYMPKSTNLTNKNAFTVYNSAKECKGIRFKNTLQSDSNIHSKISPNSSSENLSEVTRKINKKEDLTREENVIKECRK